MRFCSRGNAKGSSRFASGWYSFRFSRSPKKKGELKRKRTNQVSWFFIFCVAPTNQKSYSTRVDVRIGLAMLLSLQTQASFSFPSARAWCETNTAPDKGDFPLPCGMWLAKCVQTEKWRYCSRAWRYQICTHRCNCSFIFHFVPEGSEGAAGTSTSGRFGYSLTTRHLATVNIGESKKKRKIGSATFMRIGGVQTRNKSSKKKKKNIIKNIFKLIFVHFLDKGV